MKFVIFAVLFAGTCVAFPSGDGDDTTGAEHNAAEYPVAVTDEASDEVFVASPSDDDDSVGVPEPSYIQTVPNYPVPWVVTGAYTEPDATEAESETTEAESDTTGDESGASGAEYNAAEYPVDVTDDALEED